MSVSSVKKERKKNNQLRGRQVDATALAEVCDLLGDSARRRDLLIEYLHLIQDKYHQISAAHIVALATEMKLSHTEVYEVASFYHHFNITKESDAPAPELTIRVCNSISCEMFGAETLLNELSNLASDKIRIQTVPCVGRCHDAPVAVVGTHPLAKATVGKVENAINNNMIEATPGEYLNYHDYTKTAGYKLLKDCHAGKHSAESIIALVKNSKLQGLGGAGFPAGMKWEILRQQAGPRIMAVNIDEGEPGTFKDRYYLERDPHRFIEGMLIAGWVIGAAEIYIYLRDEYAGCRKILQQELKLLQDNPPCPLPQLQLRRGAGAYICGEESAMIESIEGKRGMPRLRPPYVAEVGLFGRPTLEHNMETLYWVRDIIEKGADWFTSQGRHGRQGFRSYSVSGRVQKPGVHLAPAGITVRELIDEYCGGMLPDHKFYGYFPGGASGGILPARMGDIPLDFDTLNEFG
ncbi:MAG: NAD(P)H-dependent oxidoreductase subunit E, partial [Gammaproteobacteria bacterium]|nr:NAD(P)H-dependent oxidoreductase subunit E [Gammaproteobacteria bacterium]